MNIFRGDLCRTNAVFVLCVLPMLVRVWIEAVVWRIERGPQMVGFSLMHGGAGYWTVPLVVSLLAIQVYTLWAVIIGVRSIVPNWRSSMSGKWSVLAGVASTWLFVYLGDALQVELASVLLYAGIAAMSALLASLAWLAARALLHLKPPASPAETDV